MSKVHQTFNEVPSPVEPPKGDRKPLPGHACVSFAQSSSPEFRHSPVSTLSQISCVVEEFRRTHQPHTLSVVHALWEHSLFQAVVAKTCPVDQLD